MTKKQLRRQYAAQRQSISTPDMHRLVASMLHHFQQLPWPILHYLMSYKASTFKQEVPIHFFEEWLREEYRQLVVCYPKADFATNQMEAYEDNDNLDWEETAYGIEQPCTGDRVLPGQLDAVLVPLLAFDEKGYRIGYGKGFYDRYLPRCRPDTVKIGVSFFEAVPIISDTGQYDVPLSYCVTPQRLYVF